VFFLSFVPPVSVDMHAAMPNVAPHLPPPRRQVERKQNVQIRRGHRTEGAGGG